MIFGEYVKVDVGGAVFKTSEATLKKFGGLFNTILASGVPVQRDETGSPFFFFFIDRSPKHFDLILNFMRDGDVELPDTEKELKEIQKEAQYYELSGLLGLVFAKILVKFPNKLPIIENDVQMLQLITYPVKPVIILHYPVDKHGIIRHPNGFDVISFLEKYKTKFDIYIKPNKPKFGCLGTPKWKWTIHAFQHDCVQGGGVGNFTTLIEASIGKYFNGFNNSTAPMDNGM